MRTALLQRMKLWFSSNDYAKLAALCFALVSLPLITLGLFSYFKSAGMLESNVSREKVLHIAQIQSNIEQMLKTIELSATHFLSSQSLKSAYYEPLSPIQFEKYNEIKSELSHLQTMDNKITDIAMYSGEGNWVINNSGLYRLDTYPGASMLLRIAEQSNATEWKVISGGNDNRLGCAANTVHLVKKLPLTAYEQTGLFLVTVPSCNLLDTLSFDRSSESVLILDNTNQVFAGEGQLSDALRAQVAQAVMSQSGQSFTGQLTATVDRVNYAITYRKSSYNGWTYVSAVPLNHLLKQTREIGWFTVTLCLLLLAFFIFLSWRWSKKLYLPIVNLYNLLAKQTNETRQAKGELHYIGDQLQRLLHTKTELESKLYGHLEQSKTLFMVRLLQGHLKEAEIIRSLTSLRMAQPASPYFAVVAVRIHALEKAGYEAKDHDLLLFAINNIVGELIPSEKRLHPIVLADTQVSLIFSDHSEKEAFMSELSAFAALISKTVLEYLRLEVSIGISSPGAEWKDAHRVYQEGMEALSFGSRLNEGHVTYFEDLGEDHALHYSFPHLIEAELFDAIKRLDQESVKENLQLLIEDAFPPNSSPSAPYPFVLNRLLINLLGLMQSLGIRSEPTGDEHHSMFDRLFELRSAEEAEGWFRTTLIDPLMMQIQDRTESRHQLITKHMVQMIQEEFETDLSIETCAERLHYNANYLNSIFRKEMGLPFGAYLAQYRHQMAKVWLAETTMSVKEISERLRYNNSQNFIRSFRKAEGVTPGKYKESLGTEQSNE
ncbi:helix-turn-helix domain-containing protein [Paenibacillus sp. GD4]|uniref:helix-turn-helix domain-containing protein n=1 Tax=Paenibacillus sp. GD4 TaxID=3068890 RepID=UPI00279643E1|nr:helix-turn-helix domain-containing protein [Paenibacillus sp. GD4]MDQ1913764.1 helix-turn-helix domain-containing protein [Paenibacillus sp. GD4]